VLVAFALMIGLLEGPAEILAVAAILTTIGTGALRAYRPGPVDIGFVVWGLAGYYGLAIDGGRHSSLDTTRPLLALALLVGKCGLGRDPVVERRMAIAFIGACAINVAYGLVQYVAGALPLDPYLLENPASAQIWVPNRVYHVRAASGLFYNRLKLAHVGMCGALLASAIALSPSVRSRMRVLAAGSALFIAGGLYFTYARMALVAIAAGGLVLALALRRFWVVGVAAGASVLAALPLLATEEGRARMSSLAEDLALRRAMMETGLRIWSEHPLLGVGHGVYRNVASALEGTGLTGVHLMNPHNLWLQLLAETGLIGFAGMNVAIVGCFVSVVRRLRADRDRVMDRTALLGLSAILFVGLVHFSLHHPSVGLLFFTFAGVCVRRLGDGQAQEAGG
jgi:O-antigen ligase